MSSLDEEEILDAVAVIGMAGRFPDAPDLARFWRNLEEGVESIRPLSDEELLAAGVSPARLSDPGLVKAGTTLDGVELFDAPFFGFNPREAEILDPQQRFLLEVAWTALENAGYDAPGYPGRIGVYVSGRISDYFLRNLSSNPDLMGRMSPLQVQFGNDKDYFATLVSYKLNLRGPSVSVQTACSSSLVAVHLACESVLNGQCDMALAGGVAINLPQRAGYFYQPGGVFSPDGHCRAFDADGAGTVFGSGVGLVVLKRLDRALADGDSILAVVRGSAINNDGSQKVGFSAPSENGQAGVIAEALEVAGIHPESIGYVEAHGTGTQLGDPIEIAALSRVFRKRTDRQGFCAIGSVKTNIGHLESAAGIAGLIKAVLTLRNGAIPPSLNFRRPNPNIDFASSPFYVNVHPSPWPANGHPRRAGVSSFGMGGTNAHVVLEEAPPAAAPSPSRPWQIVVLSARGAGALDEATGNLVRHLEDYPGLDPADVAWTLQTGRKALPQRRMVVCHSLEDARQALAEPDPRRVLSGVEDGERPVAFLFPGQGSQFPGMGEDLYRHEPVFRELVDRSARTLQPLLGFDLRRVLFPEAGEIEEARARLDRTAVTQPALFTVEYALAQLLRSWGVVPECMLGHSIGEYVAACLAGVFTLEEALTLVAERGRLMEGLPPGAMLAVSLPAEQVAPWLGADLDLAAVNGPSLCSVAGPPEAIDALAAELGRRGVENRRLHTSHAFHSRQTEPILERFAEAVGRVALQPPRIPFVSNLTGTWIEPAEATDPAYWVRHLRGTVLFARGAETLLERPQRILLEVGPGRSLATLARQAAKAPGTLILPALRAPRDEGSDLAALLTAVGRLWLTGVPVDWKGLHSRERRRRLPLPTYPFERRRYWIEPRGTLVRQTVLAEAPALVDGPAVEEETALVLHGRPELQGAYVAPRTDTERGVLRIWQELLGIEAIGVHDSFFELGGHSLLLVQVLARLRDVFRVELPLRSVAAAATVAELALEVEEAEAGFGTASSVPALRADPEGRYEPFPLTEVQEAYWIGRSGVFQLGNVATHQYFEIERESLDLDRFTRAWRRIIDRHDMMRAVMLPDGRQRVLAEVPPYEIEVLDVRGLPPAEAEARIDEVRRQMSHQVIPADRWPLFEIRATRMDGGRFRLHLSLDLLIADAWSVELLKLELADFYADPEAVRPPLDLRFRDCVLSEVAFRESESYRLATEYWLDRLPSLPGAPELPLAKNPADLTRPRFVRRRGALEEPDWSRLKARAARAGLTPSGILLAVYSEVLGTWSKSPRFLLNLTVFNRPPIHPQITQVVGDFTSLSLLEVDLAASATFEEGARALQARLWEDLDHRAVSGVRVQRERMRREGGVTGTMAPVVFTSVMNLPGSEDEAPPGVTAADLLGQDPFAISQTPQVWIDHVATERYGILLFTWDAVEDLFPPGVLQALFEAYCALLERLAREEAAWSEGHLRLLPEPQRRVREAVNATEAALPAGLLHEPVAAQAALRSAAPAVIASGRTLSYGELHRLANRVAWRLREEGARPNRLVAVVMEKGWEQVVAVLGILRSGAAYLPVDPALPEERLRYLLEQGEADLALTQARWDAELPWPSGVRRLVLTDEELAAWPDGDLEPVQGPDDLAYVIFTSGTTGLPKGVAIDHRGAANTVADVNQRFTVGPDDRVLALSSLSFDLSVYDIFGLLSAGGALVLPDPGASREPAHWLDRMTRHGVTLWNTVPALLKMLVDSISGRGLPAVPLRLVLLSGDWIPVPLPDQVRTVFPGSRVISLGGATEASIWSILYPVGAVDLAWTSIPYGRPMANQRFHVLNDLLEPCPDWVSGQLYIGGAGLARGYWRDPEKTAASFFVHPRTGERLYRTGDLGRWLPGGEIEFLGREDSQVKVQGYRIELGEIETVLVRHPAVREAVVAAVGDPRGEKRLIAYVVPEERQSAEAAFDPFAAEEGGGLGLLRDPLERLEFKTREPGLRPEEDREAIELPRREADEDRVRPYRERRSHRRFRPEAVPFGHLGELLGCLGLLEVDGKVRYRYPSAGSLYPVQVYVAVKPGRVEGIAGGAYYFHPRHRHLVRLSESVLDARLFGPENAPVFDRSAFALFLVGQLQAIAPIYGSRARDFCLLEAGYMSQLLMTSAPASRIGLCPIGTLYFEPLRRLFALEESHEFLHALVGGGLDETPAGAGADDYDLFLQLLHEEAGERAAVALAAPPAGALQVDADLVREVREMLAAQLPDYMIPSGFVALESLPLSPNGKVDRRALPLPGGGGGEPGEEHVSPRDEVEERAAAVWGEVLGVERVGVHDNFFREGGHSLLAARLIARLREEFQVELPLAALFEAPTVAGLAAALRRGRPAGAAPAEGLPALVPAPDSRYEPFPLSDLQEAYWVGRSGEIELGASPLYYLELDIPGLDLERLGHALRRLIERHDMLRASVLPDGRQQILREAAPCEIAFADLRDVAEGQRQTALDELRQRLAVQGPRVDRPPLLEVAVARLDERRSRLFLSISLLICDAWSFRIFSGELARLYADPGAELPALELSFRDYGLALAGLQKTAAYRRSEEYWWRRLETLPPAPELPLARNPASIARSRMVRRAGALQAEAWQRFKEQAARFGVTADAALGTAYAQVIGTWSKSRRFTLNVLYFNRLDLHPQVGALLGNFSSTLLLEVDHERPEPFEARARRLQQQLWNDIEHGHVTGIRVLRELNRRQGRGARTAMPVVFASTAGLGQGGRGEEPRAAMVGEPVETRLQTPQVWLDHQVFETGGTVSFNWDAVEELFPPGLIQTMFDAYCALLARLAEGEAAWSGVLPSLVPETQLALRAAANATDEPLPPGRLDELFTAQAERRSGEPAVLASGRSVTYGELDASAERIARILRRQGAERDRLVAVVMDRGWEQVAAVLGVLRAGAAYLPLSSALPRERLWQLLEQAEVEAVLTQPAVEERLSWPSGVRRIPVDESLLRPVSGERLSPVGGPEDLAYVIFTSGSTGLPKGVMIEHRSAVNTVLDMNRRFGIGPEDRILAVSSLSFDLSVYDLFGPLAAGGAVVLLDEEETREPVRWLDKIERDRVTVWNSVPALLEMLADEVESRSAELPGSLRLVLLSGDWIPVTLPGRVHALQPEARVVSLGGATEASIWSILFPIEEVDSSWTSIPYGRPMANQRFHVLNDSLEPCPVWVPGQLFIAGGGLARGYWRNEDATRASFFFHPATGERLYRTGDLGRYLPDGTIEFLGREDFQVKIQGYRIELEEIDTALVRHPGVRAGVTVAVGEKRGSKRLVAFIVPEAEGGPTSVGLSAFLAEKLPAYMVPHGIVALDELPLTANGKVDRGALAEMGSARPARSTGFVAPRDRYEERLAAIWEEILEVRPVGVSDDFFALGGHSLLGVRLMARIRAELGRDLPLVALLEGPTVEHLAALLARAEVPGRTSILVPLQRSGERAPLFLVHPVGGSVLCYGELARALGDGQPCYGLQVPEGQSPAAGGVEEMAARYVEAVRSAQPAGPYRLGGWSMGGVVAFEMARQMRAAGEEVELLVLLDVPAAEGSAPAEMDDADLLAWFARDLGELSGVSPDLNAALLRTLPPGERLPRLLEEARRAGALPSDVEADGLARHLETFKSNAGALLRYRPQPYPGSVLLVLAEESAARNGDDPSLGWSALAGGGVEVRRVPGNHYTVVRQPGVSALAELLRGRLEGEAP